MSSSEDSTSQSTGDSIKDPSVQSPPGNSGSVTSHHCETKYIYVDFEPNDPRNPTNYSHRKKWIITSIACFFTLVAGITSAGYNMGFPSMISDLATSRHQAMIGLSVFLLGFGVVPLVTAPFSEEFGRLPLYCVSLVGFLLMYVVIARAESILAVQLGRFFQGAFGSTGATMVGGTVADIWPHEQRGLPMALFSLMAVGGNGLGPVIAGLIQYNDSLQWRWSQWIQMSVCAACFLCIPLMGETRSAIILIRIARKIRKDTGNPQYRAKIEDERTSLKHLIWTSCTRPLFLLISEPIVTSFSVWIGLAWGIVYCMISSVGLVFTELHGFNVAQAGLGFLALVVGSLIGFGTNFIQEWLYRKYFPTKGVEARLYSACYAAILFPIGMFIYGASCSPSVHWSGLVIGIMIFLWATYTIYLAVFSYLADCYGPYASSALAAQSLFRNILAAIFPLFSQQMYQTLTYRWANVLFGSLAVLMIPIPYVLLWYGPAIRNHSRFCKRVMDAHSKPEQSDLKTSKEKV
ncbi:drug transporter [Coprinopsis marcescibilis]|uniref:Drug transporter n=1 Tax=Coprinopsis marcescibilis TaxID=230819 RepID=A0A5C3L4T1_COPMA|nr:drug transporter [Coprinopsis marcescibilis]